MSEHTPGPWSVGHTRQSPTDPGIGPFYLTAIHVGDPGAGPGKVPGNVLAFACMGGLGGIDAAREAVEANARLIAAAPDLLAALQFLVEAVEMDVMLFQGQPEKESRLGVAQSAIAKATGTTR